jgi:hypothetical protein
MPLNPNNFEKPAFTFDGIYRGLVENNADPLDAGRVQVRIFGLHDTDGTRTPVEQLPWASPALALSWSGGYNVNNKDHQNITPDPLGERYDPGSASKVAQTNYTASEYPSVDLTKFNAETIDPYGNACGTGGDFVVPKRGNWLFLFFEGGNHGTPIYFAMAPMSRDWSTQKQTRTIEIEEKIVQLKDFRTEFKPRPAAEASKTSWANTAIVNPHVDKPKIDIPQISQEDSNRDIFCTTSAQGTTVVIDNRNGKERIYVIHKNHIDFVDENGNKKEFNGTGTNHEVGVDGNYELHVAGNYKLFTVGNTFIQCDENVQIDAKKNVGIVSREGDVDIIVEKGAANIDVKENVNINCHANANIKVDKNIAAQVGGNIKATVVGDVDLNVAGNASATVAGDVNLTSAGKIKIAASEIDITGVVKINGDLNVTGNTYVLGDMNITGSSIVTQFSYVLLGIDCGGFIRNRGPADLGFPLTAHGLIVLPGIGSGVGRPAKPAIAGLIPTPAKPTVKNPDIPNATKIPLHLSGETDIPNKP